MPIIHLNWTGGWLGHQTNNQSANITQQFNWMLFHKPWKTQQINQPDIILQYISNQFIILNQLVGSPGRIYMYSGSLSLPFILYNIHIPDTYNILINNGFFLHPRFGCLHQPFITIIRLCRAGSRWYVFCLSCLYINCSFCWKVCAVYYSPI